MFPMRPPFLNYPFNNFYLNSRKNAYSPFNIPFKKNVSASSNVISNTYADSFKINRTTNNRNSLNVPLSCETLTYSKNQTEKEKEKDSFAEPFEDYFFEIFGLILYFDDILIICLLFFLYEEGVKDQELFISLILLLLS